MGIAVTAVAGFLTIYCLAYGKKKNKILGVAGLAVCFIPLPLANWVGLAISARAFSIVRVDDESHRVTCSAQPVRPAKLVNLAVVACIAFRLRNAS